MTTLKQARRAEAPGARLIGQLVYIGPWRRRRAPVGTLLPAADSIEIVNDEQEQA